MVTNEADYLFEASWEVCNKVGGIYTVLTSKAAQMQSYYKNYYLIGPYFEHNAKTEFLQQPIPYEFKKAFDSLSSEGINCHYGIWDNLKGKPKVILVDFMGTAGRKNIMKEQYWNDYKIDSLRGYWDFEEPLLWSNAVGKILETLKNTTLQNNNVVAQFHEWMSSFALLYLKKNCKSIATVFTTHATVLGRALAGNGVDLYHVMDKVDPTTEAYKCGVEAKHLTEKSAALSADVFTTVSEITGIEAEKFLGRKPDILLYNGLDIAQFPSFEEISIKHRISRDRLREFLTYYYFPYYTLDMDKHLIFYTSGRFEYRNKGYDILVKALGKLNQMLKDNQDINTNTVTVFFWIPMEHHGLKIDVLENKNYYMNIKSYINSNGPEILTRLIYDAMSRKQDIGGSLVNPSFLNHLKKDLSAFERRGNPSFTTHNIDEQNNTLINAFKQNNLLNRKEDMVKVILEPVYIDGSDGFIDLSQYDVISGCHFGLFPSYYEPWGYTPLESVALGVPALTTDMSGFGRFFKNLGLKNDGVHILERLDRPEDAVIEDLSLTMYRYLKYDKQERADLKLNAKRDSAMADWKIFAENYVNAHNMALRRVMESLHTPDALAQK